MNSLTEKVGPLPVWGYGAAVFVALLAFSLFRKQQSNAATAQTSSPPPMVNTQIQPVLISPLPQAPIYNGAKNKSMVSSQQQTQ